MKPPREVWFAVDSEVRLSCWCQNELAAKITANYNNPNHAWRYFKFVLAEPAPAPTAKCENVEAVMDDTGCSREEAEDACEWAKGIVANMKTKRKPAKRKVK